jgi:hypothetical protein
LLRLTNNEYLLYEPEEYVQYQAVKKIENFVLNYYLKKKRVERRRNQAATKI